MASVKNDLRPLSRAIDATYAEIEHIVPLSRMLAMREIFHASPLLEMIRSILQRAIWSAGMGFFKEDLSKKEGNFTNAGHRVEWKPPPHVLAAINEYWEVFKHNVLDSILCYGFVVVHFQYPEERLDEEEEVYPYPTVVAPELYRLLVKTSLEGGTRLVALSTKSQEELPNTVVYSNLGYNVQPDGRLNSLIAKSYYNIQFLRTHIQTQMYLHKIRCQPTIVLEKDTNKNKNEAAAAALGQTMSLTNNLTSDGSLRGLNFADRPNTTNIMEMDNFPVNVQPEVEMNNNDLLFNALRHHDYVERGDYRAANAALNMNNQSSAPRRLGVCAGIPLKNGESAKFAPLPSEGGNFHHTRHAMVESIATTFGIPLSILMGSALSSHGRGSLGENSSRVIHSMFRLTVNEWRSRISSVLTKCFSECYFNLLMKLETKQETKEKTKEKTKAKTKEKNPLNVHVEKRRRTVHLDFNPTTFVDNQELRELYEWGVIGWEIFSRFSMSNASLRIEDREKKPPPHPLGVGIDTEKGSGDKSGDKNADNGKPKTKPKALNGDKKKRKTDINSGAQSTAKKPKVENSNNTLEIIVKKG